MPRILGLNAVGVFVSAIAFFMIGYLIYGVLFQEIWMDAYGIEADAEADGDPLSMVYGFLLSLVTAFFIGLALKKMGATDLVTALKKSAFLWAGFAVTTMAYGPIYGGSSLTVFWIDCLHLLLGFTAMAAVQTLMDGKSGETSAD